MKIAKKIIFAIMCVLLVTTAILGYAVVDNALDIVLSVLAPSNTPVSTPAPSSSTVPSSSTIPSSSVPTGSTPTIHQCEFTIKGESFEPSCDAQGYTVYTCECGKETWTDFVPALNHIYSENTVIPPTCTKDGWTERTCSRCKVTERFDPTPAAHQLSDWSEYPEENPNYKQRTCEICDFIEQRSIGSEPAWKMKISTLDPTAEYQHLQILLEIDGEERTYDIYAALADPLLKFGFLDGCPILYYSVNNESMECKLLADMLEVTIQPDGTLIMGAPSPEAPAE